LTCGAKGGRIRRWGRDGSCWIWGGRERRLHTPLFVDLAFHVEVYRPNHQIGDNVRGADAGQDERVIERNLLRCLHQEEDQQQVCAESTTKNETPIEAPFVSSEVFKTFKQADELGGGEERGDFRTREGD
jgi:hypothetical protein